jgi:hypothetical protein
MLSGQWSIDEDQFLPAQVEPVARFDRDEIPIPVKMPPERFDAVGRAINRRLGKALHEISQGAAVVGLSVVGDDGVDPVQPDLFVQVVHKPGREGAPNSIDQDCFFILDEIRIIGGSPVSGVFRPVEAPDFPIHCANPVNVFLDFFQHVCLHPLLR